jgi:hypothetical protein
MVAKQVILARKKRQNPASLYVTTFGDDPQRLLSRAVFPKPPVGVTNKGNTFLSTGGS